MAGKTIGFGVVLILLGLAGYLASGAAQITALIPAFFGLPLLLLGFLARDDKKRKVAMHIAVIVGLLGFLGSFYSLITRWTHANPSAMLAQLGMVLLTAAFVGLCVKSFIDARRQG